MKKHISLIIIAILINLCASAQLTIVSQISNFLSQSNEVFYDDLDSDGDNDMIVTTVFKGFYWCQNNGDGTFENTTKFYEDSIASNAYKITDVDQDGDPDFIYAGFNAYNNPSVFKLYLLRNDGNLQFQSIIINEEQAWLTNSITVGNLNGDAYPDIIARDTTNLFALTNNTGTGWTITSQQPFESNDHSNLLAFDLSLDGTDDVLIWENENNTLQYFNCTNGNLQNAQTILDAPYQVINIHVMDQTGDAFPDIYYTGKEFSNSYDYSLFHSGSTALLSFDQSPEVLLSSTSDVWYKSFSLHDNNADNGSEDIIVASDIYDNILEFHQMNAMSTAASYITSIPFMNGKPVEINIDNDAMQDYAVINQNRLVTFERDNANISALQRHDETIQTVNRDAIMDIDTDGDQDIVFSAVYLGNYTIYVYENLGDGNYGAVSEIALLPQGIEGYNFQVGDFDADNDDDLIVMGTWSARLFLNEGGTLIPNAVVENFNSIYGVEDFNNDGLVDLIGVDYSYHVRIFSSQVGDFFSGNNYDLGSGGVREVLDFDNDGNLDIIIISGSTTKWLRNTNPTTFTFSEVHSENIPFNIGFTTHMLQWDNDGIADFGWFYNENSAPHRIYLSGLDYTTYVEMEETIEDDFICDWNTDGLTDFLVSPSLTELFVRLHQPDGTFINTTVMPYHDEFITGVRDYDGDGLNEVLLNDFQFYLCEIGEEIIDADPSGIAFYDLNNNGVREGEEINLFIPFHIQNNGSEFNVWGVNLGTLYNLSGEVIITPEYDPSAWTLTSDSASFHLYLNGPESWPTYPLDFGFLPTTPETLITSSVNAVNFSCATETFVLQYSLHNVGNTYDSGIMQLTFDLDISPVITISPTPDSIVNEVIYWSTENFAPGDVFNCALLLEHPGVDFLGSNFIAEAIYTGETGAAQTFETEPITCAYDPNIIVVAPEGYYAEGYILSETELLYTIHFQNTGNDTAVNVRIENQLSEFHNHNTFEIVSFSHAMNYTLIADGLVQFTFDNIQLPDSSNGADISSGYVIYRIQQLSSLSVGTIITNTANIYFDLNPAIVTNSVINTIWECDQTPITITQSGSTLTCSESENIQWFFNGVLLEDETSATIVAINAGQYHVVQTEIYDCVVISDPFTILLTGEIENDELLVYPNPAKNFIRIQSSKYRDAILVQIINSNGQIIFEESKNYQSGQFIETTTWVAGLYQLKATYSNGEIHIKNFVKI